MVFVVVINANIWLVRLSWDDDHDNKKSGINSMNMLIMEGIYCLWDTYSQDIDLVFDVMTLFGNMEMEIIWECHEWLSFGESVRIMTVMVVVMCLAISRFRTLEH